MDEAALLRSVNAAPEEDGPRRTYADAAGGPRAELIRVQMELVALRRANRRGDPGYPSLARRSQTLVARHGTEWAPVIEGVDLRVTYGRGFVEGAMLDAGDFVAHGRALLELAPVIDVQLLRARPVLDAVLAMPELKRLRALDLRRNRLDDADAARLAACAHLDGLRWLDLSENDIDAAGLDAIAASPHLAGLRWLGFEHNLAADPTPEIGEEDGVVHFVRLRGQALEARVGHRPWLSAPTIEQRYPPPELF